MNALRLSLLWLAGATCVGLAAALPSSEAARVRIANFTFAPHDLVVKAGTRVTFANEDDIPHLVVATDGSFRSKALDTGDSYAISFAKAGDFKYFCGLHPQMQGTIHVAP